MTPEIEPVYLGDGWTREPEIEPQPDPAIAERCAAWMRDGGTLDPEALEMARERLSALTHAMQRVHEVVEHAQKSCGFEARAIAGELSLPARESEQFSKGYDHGRLREMQRTIEVLQAVADALSGRRA